MPDGPLSPEEVAHRGFPTAFRGFDTGEVRAYLQRVANELRESVARERELNRRLTDAEHRAAHPVVRGEDLTRLLGEEMGRILATAQEAANELRTRAEENAARILREAHDQAQRICAKAEAVLAERTEEADGEAAELRREAAAEAASLVERARREADLAAADGELRARQAVEEAQAVRARVLGDLARRRRLLQMQVETLRAGRERLVEAYRLVRRSVDEVADELERAETEARQAATVAGERAAELDVDEDPALVPTAAPAAGTPERGAPTEEPTPPAVEGAPSGADERLADGVEAPGPPQLRLLRRPQAAGGRPDAVPPPWPEEEVRVIATRPGGPPADRRPPPADHPAASGSPPASPAPPVAAPAPPTSPERRPPPAPRAQPRASSAPPVEPPAAPSEPPPAAPAAAEAPGTPAGEPPAEPPIAARATEAPQVQAVAVDELFARIRAGRADAVAKAHEVLGDEGPAPTAGGTPAEDAPSPAGDEALLQQRDAAVADLESRLTRKLKRALQDEQNELLDRLRSLRSVARPDDLLPGPADQAARYVSAADELLRSAAAAGAQFAAPGGDARPDVAGVVRELASAVTEPLRRALDRAIGTDAAAGDASAVVERIGAVYRECKAQRLEGLAGDAVTAAFSCGALAALVPQRASRWVVDDDGRPCPDCDDNALAGPTPPGCAFPTGQAHPPAHAGCRCVLVPAEVAAAVNGAG